jgi:hypothetical protein
MTPCASMMGAVAQSSKYQLPDLPLVDDGTLEGATARLGVFLQALNPCSAGTPSRGARLVAEVSVALTYPDKPADGAYVLAELAFLQHTQFGQASIAAVWMIDLVAV